MSAITTKVPQKFLIELHCHTFRSFDGFSTDQQLIEACQAKQIKALAITEHDVRCQVNVEAFRQQGISVIPGCEYTTDLGAHIIGLFVEQTLPVGSTRDAVFDCIAAQGGLVLLPHPWKPGSGYFTLYEPDAHLQQVDLMELYNGGWSAEVHQADIRQLAERYDIKLIGASDAHKAWHIGYYVAAYDYAGDMPLQQLLQSVQPEIWVDRARHKPPRALNSVQQVSLYQVLIKLFPAGLKHAIKRVLYWKKSQGYVHPQADYQRL